MTVFTLPNFFDSNLEEVLSEIGEQLSGISYSDELIPLATQEDDIIAPLVPEEGAEGYLVVGLDGDDMLYGGLGSDLIFGGKGNDRIWTTPVFEAVPVETVQPLELNSLEVEEDVVSFSVDAAYGGKGSDVMNGGASIDLLFGGDGSDEIYGYGGSDLLVGGRGADVMYGGDGSDALYGGISSDRLFGGDGADIVFGDGGNDFVNGNDGDDFLNGGRGHDRISGGIGDDTLFGGQGNDIMRGGQGNDFMDGGFGVDDFAFRGSFGEDTVDNFEIGHDLLSFDMPVTVIQDGNDTVVTAVGPEIGGAINSVTFLDTDAVDLAEEYGLGLWLV